MLLLMMIMLILVLLTLQSDTSVCWEAQWGAGRQPKNKYLTSFCALLVFAISLHYTDVAVAVAVAGIVIACAPFINTAATARMAVADSAI